MAVKPLQIDFAHDGAPRAGWSGLGIGLLFAGVAAAAFALWELGGTQRSLAEANERAALLAQLARPTSRTAPPEPVVPPSQIASINEAIRQLNLPWSELLRIVEERTPKQIALLSLEPDARKNELRIWAEAKTPEDMTAFLKTLQAEPRLAEVALQKHENNDKDANRPYRFQLITRWRAGEQKEAVR